MILNKYSTIAIVLGLFLITWLILYLLTESDSSLSSSTKKSPINSYEDCVQAGYPVVLTYPEQCRTPDGRLFTKEQPTPFPSDEFYVNKCGDGVCQEITCAAQGCPKPETPITCPQDCSR